MPDDSKNSSYRESARGSTGGAPEGATHWKAKKRRADTGAWEPMSWNLTTTKGAVQAVVKVQLFGIDEWPAGAVDAAELLRARWGDGEFRIVWVKAGDGGANPAILGAPADIVVQPAAQVYGVAAQAGAQTGAQTVGSASFPPEAAARMGGILLGVEGGRPGAVPPNFGSMDPSSQTLFALQFLLQAQAQAQANARLDADERVKREREEYERRRKEEREDNDRRWQQEQQRMRDYYNQVERNRLEFEKAMKDEDSTRDSIDELKEELRSLKASKGESALPGWVSAVKELAPHLGPSVNKALSGIVESVVKDQVAKAGAGVLPK